MAEPSIASPVVLACASARIEEPGKNIKAVLYDARYGVSRVVEALYLKDEPAGRAALQLLERQAGDPASELDAEQREVLGLYACWLDWQLVRAFHFEQRQAKREQVLARLALPQQTRLGTIMRAKLELQLRCNSEGPAKLDFAPEQFLPLYHSIPEAERHSELMYYAASWAFRHRNMAVLEDCFEHFTFHADGVSSDYSWQYVNIMYQLLRGTATARDVHEHLKRLSFPQELAQFEKFILPEVERLGLLSAELHVEIASVRHHLAQLPPRVPVPELPTKHLARLAAAAQPSLS